MKLVKIPSSIVIMMVEFTLKRTTTIIIRYNCNCLWGMTNTVGVISVFTSKGIEYGQIQSGVTELDNYYDAYMLPEILSPVFKPPYVL